MSTLIMKFGGTTVGNVSALTQVLSIVMHEQKRWDRLLLVASALEGVTDMLLEAAQLALVNNQRGYRRITANVRTRHLALVEQLPFGANERMALQADIDRLLFEMLDVCQSVANNMQTDELSPEASDAIAAVGERLAARIIAALLRKNELRAVAVDSTDIIITDNAHSHAKPDLEATQERVNQHLRPMLERQIIPVITGFIGATSDGKITTLGRGGSDYTASILSVCTAADEIWIWSNVDGMMSTDPDLVSNARIIEELTYEEVAELAYFGARILHARMIPPIQTAQIPLRIRNVFKPQQAGTLIRNGKTTKQPQIKAVTSIYGMGIWGNRSGNLAKITELVDETILNRYSTRVDVMISTQSSSRSFLCIVLPTTTGIDSDLSDLQTLLQEQLATFPQESHYEWQVEPVSVITIIGDKISHALPVIANILNQLHDIHIIDIAQGPSECSLSLIIRNTDTNEVLNRIHSFILAHN